MNIVLKVTSFVYLLGSINGQESGEPCATLQYLELGERGIINCSISNTTYAVSWYESENYLKEYPVIFYSEYGKDGNGYHSGEYDIALNGSLIIRKVNVHHENIFTLSYLYDGITTPILFFINVIVIKKPLNPFPLINACRSERICYRLGVHNLLNCSVFDARPPVNLTWHLKSPVLDKDISFDIVQTYQNEGYTTVATKNLKTNVSVPLTILVCKAESEPGILSWRESMVIVENGDTDLSSFTPTRKIVKMYDRLQLSCPHKEVGLFVWKKRKETGKEFHELGFGVVVGEKYKKVYVDDFTLGEMGSLVIPKVTIEHEGFYSCISDDGITQQENFYLVATFVSSGLVVKDCNKETSCVLETKGEGTLTCILNRVRPQVELMWKTFHDEMRNNISLKSHRTTFVKNNDGTFNLTLHSDYRVIGGSLHRLVMECRVFGPYENQLNLTKTVDLVFARGHTTTKDKNSTLESVSPLTWAIPVAAFIFVLSVAAGIFLTLRLSNSNKVDTQTEGNEADDSNEMTSMIQRNSTATEHREGPTDTIVNPEQISEEVICLKKQRKSYARKNKKAEVLKKDFLKELKGKYKILYHAVQPVPFLRNKKLSVHKVFVEGGILVLDQGSELFGDGVWKPLDSYRNILTLQTSGLIIIEGEPGYGKSTTALQLAYEWCNSEEELNVHLKDVDVLIYLRLRQLKGVKSIYEAIRRFILPKDCRLDENVIEEILQECQEIVIILEGYDEFPCQSDDDENNIISIIRGDMFRQSKVIVTTRLFCLPPNVSPNAKRLRLTGFNDSSCKDYISKAVVHGYEGAFKRLEGHMRNNAILLDLFQVPIIFVMFAHITHKLEDFQKIKSVTSCFRCVISSFKSHMEQKMIDKNDSYHMFVERLASVENCNQILGEIAFKEFTSNVKGGVWRKDEICDKLSEEDYKFYIQMGILVEEEEMMMMIDDISKSHNRDCFQYNTTVRFFHKIFGEWYAAHYLCEYLKKNPHADLNKLFLHLDPDDVNYLYRFACGIKSDSADRIIGYLKTINGGEKFAILCILEKTGNVDNILETISQLCKEGIIISFYDSLLLQRSSLQLLNIATHHNIDIELVTLHNCLREVDVQSKTIKLLSNLQLSSDMPFLSLEIILSNRQEANEHVESALEYASTCKKLKQLWFIGFVPPRVVKNSAILVDLQSRNITVKGKLTRNGRWYILNLQTGAWEDAEERWEITDEKFEEMLKEKEVILKGRTDSDYIVDVRKYREDLRRQKEEESCRQVDDVEKVEDN